jgi:hypothetical protein
MPKDHWEGFEKERLFHDILSEMEQGGVCLKAKHLRRIIKLVNPEFIKGLFERRPCIRTLKYKGWCWSEEKLACESDDHFRVGEMYESVDFNGGTYIIKENDKLIGAGYFERVD